MANESSAVDGETASRPTTFLQPTLECDLVMKGGITSGIVYPQAILALAPTYRFRSVGGTSAGAIAAVLTAAAEYGRASGGFEKLKRITEALAEPNGLLRLFQPHASTRPLFAALMAYMQLPATGPRSQATVTEGPWQALSLFGRLAATANVPRVASWGRRGFLLGLLLALGFGLVFGALQLASGVPIAYNIVGAFMIAVGMPLALIAGWLGKRIGAAYSFFGIATKSVPTNNFGICTGMSDSEIPDASDALTPWMHHAINALAGLPEDSAPLTFAQLRTPSSGLPISLRMITSNLSHNRPYDLPLRHRIWLAKTDEFSRLFPQVVMDALLQNAFASPAARPPEGYFYLPETDDLPVVVAARMSLSFPLLLSAVPLYTVKPSAFVKERRNDDNTISVTPGDLQRNWFSDGGICSNFPIHFFDTWLPGRPTFGIKLTDFPREAFNPRTGHLDMDYLGQLRQAERAAPAAPFEDIDATPAGASTTPAAPQPIEPIYLSPANRPPTPEWTPLENPAGIGSADGPPSLLRFLWNIFSTAQNYRDNMQSDLPSYRERIVQIRLKETEGGLNLAMSPETVKAIMQKGALAGQQLLKHFSFAEHQWVRLLTITARIEAATTEVSESLQSKRFDPAHLVALQQRTPGFPYQRPRKYWALRTLARFRSAEGFLHVWSGKHFQYRVPEPEPTLQVTPRL